MLAEVARRRSSWLRSLATARRLSRPLQLQNTARPSEDDDGDEAASDKWPPVHGGRRSTGAEPQSLNAHLQLQLQLHASGGGNATIAASIKRRETERLVEQQVMKEQQVTLQADAKIGDFPSVIASGSPAPKDLDRARESLHKLAKDLADARAGVARETGFERARRQYKASTGKLDRMLYSMRQRRDYAQVEAVAFMWEEEFPHFARKRKHWSVICEHYAWALNSQQRFQDVVDKFSNCYREEKEEKQSVHNLNLLTPRLAQSIFVALGHLRDADGALQLLDTMQRRGVHVTKVSYFHALNALLHDQTFTDFERVMQVCEEMVTKLPGEIVPLSLLPMVVMTAAACGKSKRAMRFYSHPPDMPMSIFTEFRFEICLQQLNHLEEDEMLMEMYRNLMESAEASRDLKERVSKYLFRKRVALTTVDTRNKRLDVACEILEIMNQHKIPVSHHAIYPLLRALLLEPLPLNCGDGDSDHVEDEQAQIRVESADDLRKFFSRFPRSLEWNVFTLCEAIVAGVRAHRADLVDDLCVYALDNSMPIKYAALEQVVVFYYRLGLIKDLERVSAMVRALRLNKHIPLGIAVTEIGMAANFRLHRYEEVVILFEDFSSLDGERRRVLKRRFMLQTVLDAYKHLGRGDEAMAIQELLRQCHSTLLDGGENIDGKEGMDEESADENELVDDDSNSDEIGEQERLSLSRFNHHNSR
ncbi:hypothetical protein JG688_00010699 [Phytophthora aleatoria]|uniref:Pentacotripeptide-repeat region of PRORP domain-containing protein n=1 Tax=Phytophthora aleatoria TaxID=2496075 RepID=A0A8J5J5C6_9STRA|nr:hypothetical protein JG688_00010699 [Phytophthora aleatoria]